MSCVEGTYSDLYKSGMSIARAAESAHTCGERTSVRAEVFSLDFSKASGVQVKISELVESTWRMVL